jgi:hypothetical protein
MASQPPSSSTWRWSSSSEGGAWGFTSFQAGSGLAVGGASVLGVGSGFAPIHRTLDGARWGVAGY